MVFTENPQPVIAVISYLSNLTDHLNIQAATL